ncbi:MAG: phosphatidate cytidylyltransferase [Blautia sp.]|nr:phosphatidate cytidylyltransferase [Blautia sp.]
MFKTRLLSGIVLVVLALVTIMLGGWVLLVTLAALSLAGMQELYKAMGIHTGEFNFLEYAGYACAVLYYIAAYNSFERLGAPFMILSLIILMGVYVFCYPVFEAEQVMVTYFGLIYVAVMLSFLMLSRSLPGGSKIVWLTFFSAWGCDTCAYCAGMLFGKHKMAPVLSPKKSMEGAVGGVVGSALLGIIYGLIVGGKPFEYALICLFGALLSMVGDLAASAIKRNRGIKDYGTLIPGHGGILDRFDSIIFTAPVIYFLAKLLLTL